MECREQPIRIGVVDDHAIFREGLLVLLRRMANLSLEVVMECGNGSEALTSLAKKPVDVMLMDVQMPVLDGIAATQEIAQQFPETKIIALSSFGELAPVLEMVHAGAKGYLLKNVSKDELSMAIQEVAAGRLYFTPEVEALIQNDGNASGGRPDHPLSEREQEILRFICQGKTNKEIAEALYISKRTVDGHRERIMQKTGSRHLIDLFLYAIRRHIHRL